MANTNIRKPRFILHKDGKPCGMHVGCSKAERAAQKLGASGGIAAALEKLAFGQSMDCDAGVRVQRLDDFESPVPDPVKEARSGKFNR